MATFSVDITDVVFAGTRTGHKDITITGMPAGGVTVSLTGSNPTYFTYKNNPESKGTNVYRVSTKSTNTSSSGSDRTATFKIVNTSDSTDYVTVSLKQIRNWGEVNVYKGTSSYSDIYVVPSGSFGYFPYSLSDSIGHIEVLVDGYTAYGTSDTWISVLAETTYTDTGFKKILVSCSNNTDGPRTGNIYLDESSYGDITIYQNGHPSSTSGCTQSLSFLKSGGTESIVLNTSSSITSLGGQYLSDFTSPTLNKIDKNNYSVTIGTNNTGSDLTGLVWFVDAKNSYIGHTIITQSGAEAASLTISPTGASVGSAAGTTSVTVTSTGIDTVEYSIEEGWVSLKTQSSNVYTFSYTANTTSSRRSCIITFYGGGLSKSFVINQAAGAISVSPKSQNVDFTSGTVQVTVTGANNINYSISDSWLTYQSKSGDVYTFSYDANNNFYSRTSTVTFSASEFEPVTYTLIQYGRTASFSVIPLSLTFHKEGGSDNLTFFNIPDGGLSWNITYGSGTDWISSLSFNNNVATVIVTENTGSRRNAVIRFYNKNDNDDYLDLNVVQNGEGFDSIWFDRSFEPSSFQVGENYHYRLQDHNTNKIIYEGITVPVSEEEKPLGINIPRLVDSYINSDELDGLREDMKLRTLKGSLSVDFYDMNGSTPSLVKTFNYWNDWSGPGYKTVYDITQSINDPINHKGCNYMVIPFCIYDDELSSYSVVETKKDDTQVSYPMGTPSDAFMYVAGEFFNAKSVSFKKGNDTLLTYDMDNCGEGFLLYKNRFGGWDSFLIEGNIYKYDEYTRLRGVYPKYPNGYGYSREKMTDRNTIKTRYEINTGWLTDEQAERLVFHLMSSTTVALRSFSDRTTSSFPYNMVSVSIVDSSVEYKKFKNGKKMINYTIKLEENDTKQVQR